MQVAAARVAVRAAAARGAVARAVTVRAAAAALVVVERVVAERVVAAGGGGARVLAGRRPHADDTDEDGERRSKNGHDPRAERAAHLLLLRSLLRLVSVELAEQVVELVETGADGGRTRHDEVARTSPPTGARLALAKRIIPVRHGSNEALRSTRCDAPNWSRSHGTPVLSCGSPLDNGRTPEGEAGTD